MVHLAVSSSSVTFERMQEPLSERGIRVTYFSPSGRTIEITATHPQWASDQFDLGYIYPSRVMEAGVADAVLNLSWINDRNAILRSRNKAEVLARVSNAGVPVPQTHLVSNPVDEEALITVWDAMSGDVVVKPNSTTRGVGVARARDLDSFLGIVDYLNLVHDFRATGDKSFLVQEFIPQARDLRIMVLDGTYAGAVERHRPESLQGKRWKHNVHRGARAEGITPSPSAISMAERVAEILEIPILGVDLLVSPDRTLLSETNARPTIDHAHKYEDGFWDRLASLITGRV